MTCLYELLFDGQIEDERSRLVGLLDPEKLSYDPKLSGVSGELSSSNRPPNGGMSFSLSGDEASAEKASSTKQGKKAKTAQEAQKLEPIVR